MTDASQLRAQVEAMDKKFGANRLLLFTMGLRLRTMDYEGLFGGFLTDDKDDKKVDFCKIDEDSGVALIAQGWESPNWTGGDPPVNKASDLNTAAAWTLEGDPTKIGRKEIRTFAQELRAALEAGEVTRVELLYVHNRPHSKNVDTELDTVRKTLNQLLAKYGKGGAQPEGVVLQASVDKVIEWHDAMHETILVKDELPLKLLTKPATMKGEKWEAIVSSVYASQLVEYHKKYDDKLFSPNIRDYIGSREARGNINQQIETTSIAEPKNFWVYNNGVTILTHGITPVSDLEVRLQGIGIINGAQTTGSLAKGAGRGDVKDAAVLARIVKCNDPAVIEKIIRYNNSQNPVKTWDLRAIDVTQRNLVARFAELGMQYHIRRGDEKRGAGDVNIDKLGSFLCGFYGNPLRAPYKTQIFEDNKIYADLFSDASNVKNLLFVYRLGNATYLARDYLRAKIDAKNADEQERERHELFRHGTFPFLLLSCVADVLSIWFGKEKSYRRLVSLKTSLLMDTQKCEALLAELVGHIIPIVHQELKKRGNAYADLKSAKAMTEVGGTTRLFVEQVHMAVPLTYKKYLDVLELAK